MAGYKNLPQYKRRLHHPVFSIATCGSESWVLKTSHINGSIVSNNILPQDSTHYFDGKENERICDTKDEWR